MAKQQELLACLAMNFTHDLLCVTWKSGGPGSSFVWIVCSLLAITVWNLGMEGSEAVCCVRESS